MTEITLPSGRYLAVELPEGAKNPRIAQGLPFIDFDGDGPGSEYLPEGQWEIVEITEEALNEVLRSKRNGYYYNYDPKGNMQPGLSGWQYHLKTIFESLHSLLRKHGLNPERTVLLKDKII